MPVNFQRHHAVLIALCVFLGGARFAVCFLINFFLENEKKKKKKKKKKKRKPSLA